MRNITNIILVTFFSVIVVLSIIFIFISDNSKNKEEYDKEKVYYEIKYLDSELSNIDDVIDKIELDISKDNDYWKEEKYSIEKVYKYWNSVILDLNLVSNIDKNELYNFGKELDKALMYINENNALGLREQVTNLYKKLIVFANAIEYDETYLYILNVKYNLLIARINVEKQNWNLAHNNILEASNSIYELLTLEDSRIDKYNLNLVYIAIQELSNSLDIQDINIFKVKYNICIEKLEFDFLIKK